MAVFSRTETEVFVCVFAHLQSYLGIEPSCDVDWPDGL